MCEFSQRLMAWLDGELGKGEAEEMDRHLAECGQCRARLDAYRQASVAFEAYCSTYGDAALVAKNGRRSRKVRALYGAAAIAAAMGAFFLLTAPRQSLKQTPAEIRDAAGASRPVQTAQEPVAQTAAAPSKVTSHAENGRTAERMKRRSIPARQIQAARPEENSDSLAGTAAVEIDIPADAIFPPGAIPAGMGFTADVTMASDGSAEQIRLRPQLTGFQTRGTQR